MLTELEPETAPRQSGRPPGPRGFPLVGHLPRLARDALGFFTACAREHGDIVSLRLGAWPTLLLNHPDDLEYVLVKNHRNFVKNRFFWRHVQAIFGQGLLTSEGDFWHQQRRLAAPAFATKKVGSYAETMIDMTHRMLDGWRDGDIRDIHAEMMMLTLRIAAKTLFSAEVEEDVVEIDQAVNDMTMEIASRFSRPFYIPDVVPLPGHLRYRRGLRRVERVVERIIASRRNSREHHGDVLSMLMQALDENGQGMSDRQLRDEVITMLLAGHETTALALSWTCYLLSQHPHVDARVYTELRQTLKGRQMTLHDIAHLPVMESTFTEAMRLFPPAWTIGREALEDCEIGGYPVPAGTTILMSPWVIHRDPRFFEEPDTFRPERWTPEFLRDLPRFAYVPFGGGPRICIGKSFAMQEAMIILSMILEKFKFESLENSQVTPLPSITLRPQGDVSARLVAREA